MKHVKKLTALLLAVLIAGLLSIPVLASETYTYTVRVYPGTKGVFNDGDQVKVYTGRSPSRKPAMTTRRAAVTSRP